MVTKMTKRKQHYKKVLYMYTVLSSKGSTKLTQYHKIKFQTEIKLTSFPFKCTSTTSHVRE